MKKTVSVLIKTEQASRLREIADCIPGSSINVMVQKAVENWLEIEGTVYLDAFKRVRQSLERQPVRGVTR